MRLLKTYNHSTMRNHRLNAPAMPNVRLNVLSKCVALDRPRLDFHI